MGMKSRPTADDSWFWATIEASRADWDPNAPDHFQTGNQARQAALLEKVLGALDVDGVLRFGREFSRHFWHAYRRDLWDAAYVIEGGCGDDGFMDFRFWLISMGRDVFEKAVADPRSLADAAFRPGVEYAGFEDFGAIVGRVYRAKASAELPAFSEYHLDEPVGKGALSEQGREARYPRLAELAD